MTDRRWFHIHVSTAILMMLVAGGFFWANTFTRVGQIGGTGASGIGVPLLFYGEQFSPDTMDVSPTRFLASGLIINVLSGFVLTAFAAFLCEYLIRRRELDCEKGNPRFWRIHLSTAVILMFVAGGLIWANVQLKTVVYSKANGKDKSFYHRGWPLQFHVGSSVHPYMFINWENSDIIHLGAVEDVSALTVAGSWSIKSMMANIVIAVLVLLVTFSLCEYFIRRREARKP
jgi:MFS family permease